MTNLFVIIIILKLAFGDDAWEYILFYNISCLKSLTITLEALKRQNYFLHLRSDCLRKHYVLIFFTRSHKRVKKIKTSGVVADNALPVIENRVYSHEAGVIMVEKLWYINMGELNQNEQANLPHCLIALLSFFNNKLSLHLFQISSAEICKMQKFCYEKFRLSLFFPGVFSLSV